MPVNKLKLGQRVWLAGDPRGFGYFINPRTNLYDFFFQEPIEVVIEDMYFGPGEDKGSRKECSRKALGKMWDLLTVHVNYVRPFKDGLGLKQDFGLVRPTQCYNSAKAAARTIAKQLLRLSNKMKANLDKINRNYLKSGGTTK